MRPLTLLFHLIFLPLSTLLIASVAGAEDAQPEDMSSASDGQDAMKELPTYLVLPLSENDHIDAVDLCTCDAGLAVCFSGWVHSYKQSNGHDSVFCAVMPDPASAGGPAQVMSCFPTDPDQRQGFTLAVHTIDGRPAIAYACTGGSVRFAYPLEDTPKRSRDWKVVTLDNQVDCVYQIEFENVFEQFFTITYVSTGLTGDSSRQGVMPLASTRQVDFNVSWTFAPDSCKVRWMNVFDPAVDAYLLAQSSSKGYTGMNVLRTHLDDQSVVKGQYLTAIGDQARLYGVPLDSGPLAIPPHEGIILVNSTLLAYLDPERQGVHFQQLVAEAAGGAHWESSHFDGPGRESQIGRIQEIGGRLAMVYDDNDGFINIAWSKSNLPEIGPEWDLRRVRRGSVFMSPRGLAEFNGQPVLAGVSNGVLVVSYWAP